MRLDRLFLIVQKTTKIKYGKQKYLYLGNINAKRDWGHAKDYVYMQWLMLQQKVPEDFVISTGKMITVREFIELCAKELGWNNKGSKGIIWEGEGLDEVGYDWNTKKTIIRVSDRYFRPTEVESLLGDASKAKKVLGWEPEITFDQLIEDMVLYGQ